MQDTVMRFANAMVVAVLCLGGESLACAGPAEEPESTVAAESAEAAAPLPAADSSAAEAAASDTEASWSRPADDMAMVPVAAGEFTMGDDASPFPAERPAHLVALDAYWIDRTEVTNAQFRLCVEAGACAEPAKWTDANLNGDTQPALVPWDLAAAYCAWAGMRLPTEAEWEKAARGVDGRLWPWGPEFEDGRANLAGEADGYVHTAPVGSFPTGASPYGALDLAGNAAEWVADWYGESYYERSPGANPSGQGSGDKRVYRSTISHGGGGPEKSRTVSRYSAPPRWDYGFRCATSELPAED